MLAAARRDRLPRRRHADVHRAGRARAAARRAPARGGGDRRGESGDGHARARRAPARARRQPGLARRAELPAAPARDARAPRRPRRRPARVRATSVMPDSTTSPSTSSTASRARAPPTSSATSPRRSRSSPSTSPLRARGQAGHALHPCARRRARPPGRGDGGLLRARRRDADRRGLPLVRDGELLPCPTARRDLRARHNLGYWLGRDYLGLGIGAVSTVAGLRWRNAPSLPRYLAALGAASRRSASSSRWTRRRVRRSASCSGSGSTSRSRCRARGRSRSRGRCRAWSGSGCVCGSTAGRRLALTERGRFLGGGVTAELLA